MFVSDSSLAMAVSLSLCAHGAGQTAHAPHPLLLLSPCSAAFSQVSPLTPFNECITITSNELLCILNHFFLACHLSSKWQHTSTFFVPPTTPCSTCRPFFLSGTYFFPTDGSWNTSFHKEKRLLWESFCPMLAFWTSWRVKSFCLRPRNYI